MDTNTNTVHNRAFGSLAWVIIVMLMVWVSSPAGGAVAVRGEQGTAEQTARSLELQAEKEAAAKAEEAQRQRLESLRGALVSEGFGLNPEALTEAELLKAEDIRQSTGMSLRASATVVVYSGRFGIKPSLLLAVMEKESHFNQFSVGSHRDRGYMQIIPGTERFIARAYGPAIGLKYDPKRIFEPEYNLGLGAAFLGSMVTEYGDVHRALSEYNRGEGNLKRYYQKHRTYATDYSKTVLTLEQKYVSLNQ